MIHDLLLPTSPALARRLLHFQRLGLLHLDPAVARLAHQDRLPDGVVLPTQHAAAQFLLDCGLRAALALPEDGFNGSFLLPLLAHAAVDPVIVVAAGDTERFMWKLWARLRSPSNVIVLSPEEAFAIEVVAERSPGVLVLHWPMADLWGSYADLYHALAREYPRTLIYADPRVLRQRPNASRVYQTKPNSLEELYQRVTQDAAYKDSFHWTQLVAVLCPGEAPPRRDVPATLGPTSATAALYNICSAAVPKCYGRIFDDDGLEQNV